MGNRTYMSKNGQIILLSSFLVVAFAIGASANQLDSHSKVAASQDEAEAKKDSASVVNYHLCGQNDKARALAKLIIRSPDQLRQKLNCNGLLSKIAQKKAEEMAKAGEVTHHGKGGTPDQRLISNGYQLVLPSFAMGSNHVESILGGFSQSEEVYDQFSNSFSHRVHLFAEHPFYLSQDDIGVGYARKWTSPHVDYWAVYIAKDEDLPAQSDMLTRKEENEEISTDR